jgi:hypothetical protein
MDTVEATQVEWYVGIGLNTLVVENIVLNLEPLVDKEVRQKEVAAVCDRN